MPIPELYHLDAVAKLRGDALVTYPGGDLTVKKVERVWTGFRGSSEVELAYLTPDIEHTSALLVEQYIIGGDHQNVQVYRLYHTLPGVPLTSFGVDEETRTPVSVTTQVVAAPVGSYAQAAYSTIEYRPINAVYGTKVTTTINAGAPLPSRVERRNLEYTFPALLFGIATSSYTARDGTPALTQTPNRRSAFSRQVSARIAISYGVVGALVKPAVFAPRFNDLIYNGVAFNVSERNVLNDAFGPLVFNSGTSNPRWPFIVETYTLPGATTPDASTYLGWIGVTELCISAVIRPWRLGLERMEAVYVLAE